jgi:transposase
MAKKIKVKLILELRASGLSQREISRTRSISVHSIGDVYKISDETNVAWDDVKEKSDEEVYRIFYPDKYATDNLFKDPDYPYVHSELKKTGVTLKLLWEEYKEAASKVNAIPMGYSKYCDGYSEYTIKSKITSHLTHKPGIVCEVDWSGPTMKIIDMTTNDTITAYLFVATLPYSQYSYVEPCFDITPAIKHWTKPDTIVSDA